MEVWVFANVFIGICLRKICLGDTIETIIKLKAIDREDKSVRKHIVGGKKIKELKVNELYHVFVAIIMWWKVNKS